MPDITNQQILDELIGLEKTIKNDLRDMARKTDLKIMAIKDDLKGMATKEDIRDMATKADLEGMATKVDIRGMATKDDLKQVHIRLERKIASGQAANVQYHLQTREAIGNLNRQFGSLREGLARAAAPID